MIISNHNLRYLPPTGGIGINHPICVDTRNIESFVGCFEKHIICINIMRIRIGHHQQMPVSGKLPAKTRQSDLAFLIKNLFRITCKCRGLRQWPIRGIYIIERRVAYTTPDRGEIAAPNLHMLKQLAIAKYCRLVTNQIPFPDLDVKVAVYHHALNLRVRESTNKSQSPNTRSCSDQLAVVRNIDGANAHCEAAARVVRRDASETPSGSWPCMIGLLV